MSSVSSRSFAASASEASNGGHVPFRQCAGCRRRLPQAGLVRFVHEAAGWHADAAGTRRRRPGRGVYLCSRACGERVARNRRYPGLASTAAEYGSWSGSNDV
ncbi:MAG: DUF448 domain-containing protein [Candidatus Tyrphobacter sp.]